MCGITAVIGYSLQREAMLNSLRALSHRGPDGRGFYCDVTNQVYLGHCRLAVIDLENGAQPLTNPDKNIVLVCNGEIYGHDEIRQVLVEKGAGFSSNSDSEVILHLYAEYGNDFLSHLRGEFAFVLYDLKNNKVIAARDRFGIKPLFFSEIDGKYVFSSEAKGIFATKLVKPEIDPVEIRNTLSYVLPDSIFKDIEQLPPGTFIEIEPGRKGQIRQYWDINLRDVASNDPQYATVNSTVDMLRAKVDESIRIRLRSDVPLGVYLSGGIDSAAIAGTVSKYRHNQIHAFTVSFPDDKRFDEVGLARKMAESVGAALHVVDATNEVLLEGLQDSLWYSETPTFNLHGVGKFLLSRLASQYVKVVLTGEGADEAFLGYEYFKAPENSISSNMHGRMKPEARSVKGRHVNEMEKELGFVPQQEMKTMLSAKMQRFLVSIFNKKHKSTLESSRAIDSLIERAVPAKMKDLPPVRRIQRFSIKRMMVPYILSILGDRAEMSHSIEGRTPFLDHELFEMAQKIPDDQKIKNGREKHVFREAMKDRVIGDIYMARKWPFSAPTYYVNRRTSASMAKAIEKYLSKKAIETAGIFKYKRVRYLLWIIRLLPFEIQFKRDVNNLLVFMMSVQCLQQMYETRFQATVDENDVESDLLVDAQSVSL